VTPVLITVLEISIMQWLEGKVAPWLKYSQTPLKHHTLSTINIVVKVGEWL
jgi:hypothetical protein